MITTSRKQPNPDAARAKLQGFTIAVTEPFKPHETYLRHKIAADLTAKGFEIDFVNERGGVAIYRKPMRTGKTMASSGGNAP